MDGSMIGIDSVVYFDYYSVPQPEKNIGLLQ